MSSFLPVNCFHKIDWRQIATVIRSMRVTLAAISFKTRRKKKLFTCLGARKSMISVHFRSIEYSNIYSSNSCIFRNNFKYFFKCSCRVTLISGFNANIDQESCRIVFTFDPNPKTFYYFPLPHPPPPPSKKNHWTNIEDFEDARLKREKSLNRSHPPWSVKPMVSGKLAPVYTYLIIMNIEHKHIVVYIKNKCIYSM